MPIRINLLAEAQAVEELRRRDPLKRVILAGIVLMVLVLAWSSSLLVQTMYAKGELSKLEGSLNSRTNEHHQIVENRNRLDENKRKLAILDQLATNRFLTGNLLNILQHSTVDNVQLVRLKINQDYVSVAETKRITNSESITPGKSATVTEKILITLNAKDSSSNPGDAVSRFQETLSTNAFFRSPLASTNIVSLTRRDAPQSDQDSKQFLLFELQCRFPDKTR